MEDEERDTEGEVKTLAETKKGNIGIDIETQIEKERNILILKLMWPALLENILATLVSMADTIMVSALGTFAVSAVGLCTQPRFIVFSAFMALGTGTTALVARAKGARDEKEANTILMQSMIMAAAIVLLVSAVMLVWHQPLIRFIAGANISEESIHMAYDYFRIQIYGFPVLGLTFIFNAALRGAGNTRAAFYSNSLANVVNVIFNYLLINGKFGFPRMEVAGASLATVIGQCAGFAMVLYLLMAKKQYITLRSGLPLKPDMKTIRRIAKIGMPALFEQLAMRIGMMLFTLIVTSLGDTSYATHIIAMNIQSMSFTTGMSFGTAATTLTGQSLGRKREDLARWYTARAIRFGYILSFLVAVILFFFGGLISRAYSKEAEILALAASVLRIVALANPISNTRYVYNASLRGAGDSRFTAVSTFLGILVVRPLLAYILVFIVKLDLIGVWIALVSDALVCYALGKWRWKQGKWAALKV